MTFFNQFWQQTVDLVWGLPMVFLVIGASLYFAWSSRLLPYAGLRHGLGLLTGKYINPADPGEISHFQALSSALSGTIGMGNIAGVAIAISMGGAGAVFWMWMAAVLGMITKFFTCTLACMYRHRDEDGIEQGGPMYFIEYGLGKRFRPLAMMFAICGMAGCLPLLQANQLAGLLQSEWHIQPTATGILAAVIVGIVIFGGIRRVGKTAARLVPVMFVLYVAAGGYVILSNFEQIPGLIASIFKAAFGIKSVYAGAAGLTFKEIMVTGIKRAVFSNEAGAGTEALAHGAARTGEPVREGQVAMWGPFIDTMIVCTVTALVILVSGVKVQDSGVVMAAMAFEQFIPAVGKDLMLLVIAMFAVSTMITYSYYSVKCARYIFGKKAGTHYIYVYLLFIPIACNWTQTVAVNIIDSFFALMVIPTLTASILLAPRVIREMHAYYNRAGILK